MYGRLELSVKCSVMIDGSTTPVECDFVVLPRVGEDVFILRDGNVTMFYVTRVSHWAGGTDTEEPGTSVSLNVASRSGNILKAQA